MSVDVTAYSMFGVGAGSFREALDILLEKGIISEEEYNKSEDNGEIGHDLFGYEEYSCYSECGGVLGCYVCAEDIYCYDTKSREKIGKVVEHFPEATFHLFCQWS